MHFKDFFGTASSPFSPLTMKILLFSSVILPYEFLICIKNKYSMAFGLTLHRIYTPTQELTYVQRSKCSYYQALISPCCSLLSFHPIPKDTMILHVVSLPLVLLLMNHSDFFNSWFLKFTMCKAPHYPHCSLEFHCTGDGHLAFFFLLFIINNAVATIPVGFLGVYTHTGVSLSVNHCL